MLQRIRDNLNGFVSKIIIGFIVFTFVFFGVETLVNYESDSSVAKVNGEIISESDFRHAVVLEKRNISYQNNKEGVAEIDEAVIAQQVLEKLVDIKLLSAYAAKLLISAQKQQVDQLITDRTEFQTGGKFDPLVFKRVVESSGFTPQRYYDDFKTDLTINQLGRGYLLSNFLMESDLKNAIALVQQKRSFFTLEIPSDNFFEIVEKNDPEVIKYYEENSDKFKTEEMVAVEYIELTIDDVLDEVKISDEDLKSRYDQEVENMTAKKRLHAAHILIRVTGENDQEAKKKIERISADIQKGADFSEAARKYSEDKGSAATGGDLGITDGTVFPLNFEHTLQNLRVGEVSAPVKTEAGYHLIRLIDKENFSTPKFDEISADLRIKLSKERAQMLLKDQVENLAHFVFESSDLKEPANQLGLTIKTSNLFTRENGESIASHLKVRDQAFSDAVLLSGHNSEVIELADDHYLVLRNFRHEPSRQLSLNEVIEKVQTIVSLDAAKKRAAAMAKKCVADLYAGKSIEAIAETEKFKAQHHVQLLRNDEQNLDPKVMQAVFRAGVPSGNKIQADSVMLDKGNQVVFLLTEIVSGNPNELNEDQRKQLLSFLTISSGKRDFVSVQKQLREQADIVRYRL